MFLLFSARWYLYFILNCAYFLKRLKKKKKNTTILTVNANWGIGATPQIGNGILSFLLGNHAILVQIQCSDFVSNIFFQYAKKCLQDFDAVFNFGQSQFGLRFWEIAFRKHKVDGAKIYKRPFVFKQFIKILILEVYLLLKRRFQ